MSEEVMTTVKNVLSDKEAVAKLQHLHQVERTLSETIIQLKTEHSVASANLEAIKAEARADFGTDDLEKLRELYRNILEQNSSSILSFEEGILNAQAVVDRVKQGLRALDEQGKVA